MTEFGAAASSSSSSFTYEWSYHVFLSFRGEDTRQGFTGHLYNALHKRGIRTFLDDEGIRKGEDITPTLLKTIEESKTAIVVFSKNYASSTFCLKELVQILNCMKGRNGRFIWPVFYDVDPSDIRHQTGSYKDAFDRHEGVNDEKIVKDWRLALTEAANMSGWHFELEPRSKSYEYEMMEEIIGVVSKEISTGPLHISQFSVGLESRVKEICSLLNKQPHFDGATMVGICGIGGIGKTTTARAVYNKIAGQFHYSCFLPNIKEKSIEDLQKILLSETIGEKDIKLNYDKSGIAIIKDRLYNKKVLLILDDIDTLEQLRALAGESNWFGFGSIIIITTRDRSLLKNHKVERIYEVNELTWEEACQLLLLNAFKNKEANPGYEKVILRAVEYASGLPLVLEILGSNFHTCQTIKEWETVLDIYEKIPDKTVQKILKVSYDGLEEIQREIFLDIACFYRDIPLGDVTKNLSASHGIGVEFCIRVLIDKSLIKTDDDGCLDMHDLIQDMGQEIVRQESPIDVGRRSRLWSPKDILHVLKENTGTATIQAMNLSFDFDHMEWSGEGFEKMKNLKVLSFSLGIKFSQGPKCLPNSLRVVEWSYYPSSTLPDNFCPINLVILRLTCSRLKTLGKAFKNFYNLHELNLSGSQNLEELPDISEAVNLEVLNVSYCKKLTKIDDSVGHLAKLRVVNAEGCGRLDTFIIGGIKLVSLEILNLSNCSNLHTFPEILVTMKKIKTLNLSHTAIKIVPKSIEKLVAIKRLCLNDDKYFWPSDLEALFLEGCEQLQEIRKIPPNIEVLRGNSKLLTSSSTKALLKQNFYNLRKLDLQHCENLKELPDISGVANLEELDVSYCKKLIKIDDSVGYLSKLRVLNAERCEMLDTFIIRGIKLESIEIIDLKGCSNLHIFSEILAPIEKIKTLDLRHTAIKTLPKSIENLIALQALYLSGDNKLRQLSNLACLHNLKTLDLDFCTELEEITEIPPNIEVFSARWCISLTSCSTRLLSTQKFFNLRKLNLQGCENLKELSDVSGAAYLEELDVSYCKKLTNIDDSVGHLAKLRVLNAERCEMLGKFIVGGIELVSLEILNLWGCYKLHTFPEILVTMENIKTLDLSDTAIKILPESFEKLVTLEELYLISCKELRQLPNLALHNLKRLNLDWCKELEEIKGIPSNIEVFCARSCTSLTSHSTRLLLTQELHENGNTQFILPGKEIPKWFHKYSTEGSVSFWVRKKFPQIALCAILKNGTLFASSIKIVINGTHQFYVKDVILPQIEIEIGIDHIILFDLRKQDKYFKIGRDLLEKELNHVVVSWDGLGIGRSYQFVEGIGVYVYNYDSCMEDILFENPSSQRGTPEEVVYRICDSDLESLNACYDDREDFRDWIQEDEKLNKEIVDLTPETVSNIEKKKGQLKVDNVNLTLSLALSEPSSDTTSHHDDKLNKEIMDSSSKTASSIEKKERKLNMDYENLTLSLALPEPSNDTTSHHDLQQQQQHLTSINQQIPESSEIIKKANGKDIIVYEGNTNEKKGENTSENYRISSNSESFNWDRVTCEHQLKGQKEQSTIIDKVYDGRASHYSKDLPQQHHLSSIHQQIPKCSENVKEAKGKDIMVHEGNSNEKQCSNTLEGQLPELVHRQTQEEELHLANDKCLTHILGQRTEYFQDKDYGNRPPSKRTSDQITVEHLQEQKKKIREEVVVEVREEMRLREERMRVEFEERLASLLASFQQGLISTMFPTNAMGNATTSSTDNITSNVTPSSPRKPP